MDASPLNFFAAAMPQAVVPAAGAASGASPQTPQTGAEAAASFAAALDALSAGIFGIVDDDVADVPDETNTDPAGSEQTASPIPVLSFLPVSLPDAVQPDVKSGWTVGSQAAADGVSNSDSAPGDTGAPMVRAETSAFAFPVPIGAPSATEKGAADQTGSRAGEPSADIGGGTNQASTPVSKANESTKPSERGATVALSAQPDRSSAPEGARVPMARPAEQAVLSAAAQAVLPPAAPRPGAADLQSHDGPTTGSSEGGAEAAPIALDANGASAGDADANSGDEHRLSAAAPLKRAVPMAHRPAVNADATHESTGARTTVSVAAHQTALSQPSDHAQVPVAQDAALAQTPANPRAGGYPDVVAPRVTTPAPAVALATAPGVDVAGGVASEASRLPGETAAQIVQSLRLLVSRAGGEAHIRLEPQQFGDLSVSLRVEGRQVTARIEADAPVVREWLQSNQSVLRTSLAEHQLTLDRIEVSEPAESREAGQRDREPARDERRQQRQRRQPADGHEPFEVLA